MLIKKSLHRRPPPQSAELQALCDLLESCPTTDIPSIVSKSLNLPYPKRDLHHWIPVLNRFDTLLESLTKKYGFTVARPTTLSESDKSLILAIVSCTKFLLENAANRTVYASYEHLGDLLVCDDLDVVESVLWLLFRPIQRLTGQRSTRLGFNVSAERMLALASIWPESLRNTEDTHKYTATEATFPHEKVLFRHSFFHQPVKTTDRPHSGSATDRKQQASPNPGKHKHREGMVQIGITPTSVDMSFAATSSSSDNPPDSSVFDLGNKAPGELLAELANAYNIPGMPKIDSPANEESTPDKTPSSNNATPSSSSSTNQHSSSAQQSSSTPNQDSHQPRSSRDSQQQKDHAFSILHKCRLARGLVEGQKQRRQLVVIRLLAIGVYMLLSREEVANARFFIHEPNLVSTLVENLHPDRGLDMTVQIASMCALESASRYRLKLTEVLNHMNASANHGVLIYILRKMAGGLQQDKPVYPPAFVDELLSFVHCLISTQGGGNMLISAGIIPTLLQLIAVKSPVHGTTLYRAVYTLDALVYGFSSSFNAFIAANGLTTVIDRIDEAVSKLAQPVSGDAVMETDDSNKLPAKTEEANAPSKSVERLHEQQLLKALLKFVLHMMQTSGNAEGLRSLIDSTLPGNLGKIFNNHPKCDTSVFATATDVFATFIHNEPTSLTVLQEIKLPRIYLETVNRGLPVSNEAMCALPTAIGAICLNEAGTALVAELKPLKQLFACFTSEAHVKVLADGEWSGILGSSIDELMRHHPSLKTEATEFVLETMKELKQMGHEKTPEPGSSFQIIESSPDDKMSDAPEGDTTMATDGDAKLPKPTKAGINKDGDLFNASSTDESSVSIVTYVNALARLLENMFSNVPHCRDFIAKGGLKLLLSFYSLPAAPFTFASSQASFSLSHLFKVLSAADASKVLEAIVMEFKLQLEGADSTLANLEQQGPMYFAKIEEKDYVKRREGQDFLLRLEALHGLIGLLTDVYDPRAFITEREILEVVQCLSVSFGEELIQKLGRLHRLLLWQSIQLRSAATPELYNTRKVRKTSRKALEAWGAPPLDSNLPVDPAKEATPVSRTDPVLVNVRMLKYLLTKIPKCIVPLLQGWVKMLQNSRTTDQNLRKVTLRTATSISTMLEADLKFANALPESTDKHSFITNVFATIACFFLYDWSMTSMQIFPLIASVRSGAFDLYTGTVVQLWKALGNEEKETSSEESDKKATSPPTKAENMETACQVAFHTWGFLSSSKLLSEAYVSSSAGSRNRASLDIPAPAAFLSSLRLRLIKAIEEVWKAPFLTAAKTGTLQHLFHTLGVIYKGDGEMPSRAEGQVTETPARPSADPNKITQLMDMGFPRDAAVMALIRYSNDLGRAADYLLNHPEVLTRVARNSQGPTQTGANPDAASASHPDPQEPAIATGASEGAEAEAAQMDTNEGESTDQMEDQSDQVEGATSSSSAAEGGISTKTEQSSPALTTDTTAIGKIDPIDRQELEDVRERFRQALLVKGLDLLRVHSDLLMPMHNLCVASQVPACDITEKSMAFLSKDPSQLLEFEGIKFSATLCRLAHLFCDDDKIQAPLKIASKSVRDVVKVLETTIIKILGISSSETEQIETLSDFLLSLLGLVEPILSFAAEPSWEPLSSSQDSEDKANVNERKEREELEEAKASLKQFLTGEVRGAMLRDLTQLLTLPNAPKSDTPYKCLSGALRVMCPLTRDHELASAFVHMGGLATFLERIMDLAANVDDQPLLMIIIRHCLEARPILRQCMSEEVKGTLSPHVRRLRWKVPEYLQLNSFLAARDSMTFIAATTESLRLSVDPSSEANYYLIRRSQTMDPAPGGKEEKKTEIPKNAASDAKDQGGQSSNEEKPLPRLSENAEETSPEAVLEATQAMHRTVTGFFVERLLSLSENASQVTVDADERPTTPSLNQKDRTKSYDQKAADPDLPNHIRRCFMLQVLTEIVSSYHGCRMGFVLFSKSGKQRQSLSSGSGKSMKSQAVSHVMNDILPCEGALTEEAPDIEARKRLYESHWAELLLAALCAPSQDFGDKSGTKVEADIAFVRNVVLDHMHRTISSILSSGGKNGVSFKYGRLMTVLDLSARILQENKAYQDLANARDADGKLEDFSLGVAELMIERSFVSLFTNAISAVELEHPSAKNLVAFLLKPLDILSRAAVKLGKQSTGKGESEPSSTTIEPTTYDAASRDGAGQATADAEDILRTSALGILGGAGTGDHDEDDDGDSDSDGSEMYDDNAYELSGESDFSDEEEEVVESDDDEMDMEIMIRPEFPQQGRRRTNEEEEEESDDDELESDSDEDDGEMEEFMGDSDPEDQSVFSTGSGFIDHAVAHSSDPAVPDGTFEADMVNPEVVVDVWGGHGAGNQESIHDDGVNDDGNDDDIGGVEADDDGVRDMVLHDEESDSEEEDDLEDEILEYNDAYEQFFLDHGGQGLAVGLPGDVPDGVRNGRGFRFGAPRARRRDGPWNLPTQFPPMGGDMIFSSIFAAGPRGPGGLGGPVDSELSLRSRLARPNNVSTTIQFPPRPINGTAPDGMLDGAFEMVGAEPSNLFRELLGNNAMQVLEQLLNRRPQGAMPTTYRIEVNNSPLLFNQLAASRRVIDTRTRITITNSPIHSIHDFQLMSTIERWRQEGSMLQRNQALHHVVENRVINELLPEAMKRERETKQRRELSKKMPELEEDSSEGDDDDAEHAEDNDDEHRANETAAQETIAQTAVPLPSGDNDGSMATGADAMDVDGAITTDVAEPEVHDEDVGMEEAPSAEAIPSTQSEDATQTAGSSGQTGTSTSAARTSVRIGNRVINLADTDIDPTVLDALPEEMIPQIVEDYLRDRGELRSTEETVEAINLDEFLNVLPRAEREGLLSHDDSLRPRTAEGGGTATGSNVPAAGGSSNSAPTATSGASAAAAIRRISGEEMDAAHFLATLDPSFRRQILLEQDETVLASLPPALVAEASALQQGHSRRHPSTLRARFEGQNARNNNASGNANDSDQKKKQPVIKDAVAIIDHAGITQLMRLVFVPEIANHGVLHRVIQSLCKNSRSRADINSVLLNLLVEAVDGGAGLASGQPSARRSLSTSTPSSNKGKTTVKPSRMPSTPISNSSPSVQSVIGSLPSSPDMHILIAQRSLSTLLAVNTVHPTPFFLHPENDATCHRKSASKRRHNVQFPVVRLLMLLDKDILLGSSTLMEHIMQLLSMVLRPLERIAKQLAQDTIKKQADSQQAGISPSSSANVEASSEAKQEGTVASPTTIAAQTPAKTSSATAPSMKIPEVPEIAVKNVTDVLISGVCTGRTFQHTLTALQHLTCVTSFRRTVFAELVTRVRQIAAAVVEDLSKLTSVLKVSKTAVDVHGEALDKFTALSSEQAKLLRLLKTLDYLANKISSSHDEKKNQFPHETGTGASSKTASGSSKKTSESATSPTEKNSAETVLDEAYADASLKRLWSQLSDALECVHDQPDLMHVATVLLPLIEGYMVVCKRTKLKGGAALIPPPHRLQASQSGPPDAFAKFTTDHKKVLNMLVRNSPSLLSGSFSVLVTNPKVLEFDNKRNYFNQQLHKRPHKDHYGPLQLYLRRQYVFEDSFHQLQGKNGAELKYGKISVHFFHEEGMDAGGLTREWFSVLSREIFNPNYALFNSAGVDSVTYQPNRSSWVNPDHLLYFRFVGRFIGKAIYDGRLLDCYFTRSFYKHILGRKVDVKDLEAIDPEYYKSLDWILSNDITDVMDLYFSMEADDFGKTKVIELVAGGSNVPVTEANKREYVSLVVEQKLATAIKDQITSFLKGFHEVVPASLVQIFDEQELELLISGVPDIDIDDWKNNTIYIGYNGSSRQIQWFWRVVRGMDQEERAKLLQFTTGTSKVPLEGFTALQGANGPQKFQIHKDYGPTNRLPSAHTCFNQLDLPLYESYEALRSQLTLAIRECTTGFGLA